jgi:hypothetical protein
MVLEFIPFAVKFDKADIFCLDRETDPEWKRLMRNAQIIVIAAE